MDYNNIHIIGIGGSGISACARYYRELEKTVTGSDRADSAITRALKKLDVTIHIGEHAPTNLDPKTELVIRSNAIPDSNPEVQEALKKDIPVISFPEFVAHFSKGLIPIVITGTHGKSTITAMLAKIMTDAGLDPSVFVGAQFSEWGSNFRFGFGRYVIIEGDEYKAAFLQYKPVLLIVNSIEADHLDFYKDEEHIVQTFKKIAHRVPKGGMIIAHIMDANVARAIETAECKKITYGVGFGDYFASHIVQHGELTRSAIKGPEPFDIALRTPGEHMIQNALAAAVTALSLQIPAEHIKQSLLAYRGIQRRFEVVHRMNNALIVDDYAHHPTEIKATIRSAKDMFPDHTIVAVYQPHSADRTEYLFDAIVDSFHQADKVYVTEIYGAAGRDTSRKVSGKSVAEGIRKYQADTEFYPDFRTLPEALTRNIQKKTIILLLGAGDITELGPLLKKKLAK